MSDLSDDVQWVRDHWDDAPVRINAHGVDVQSQWGAPPFTLAMERWLDHARDQITQTTTVECPHFWTQGQRAGCMDCGGFGTMQKATKVFRFPMRAALARLRKHAHAAPGVVHPATFVYRLAVMDWNVEAACASVGLPQERGEEQLHSAITLLRARYGERPYLSSISESQSKALYEAVA